MPIYLVKPMQVEMAAKPQGNNPIIPEPPVIPVVKDAFEKTIQKVFSPRTKRRPARSPALAYA